MDDPDVHMYVWLKNVAFSSIFFRIICCFVKATFGSTCIFW